MASMRRGLWHAPVSRTAAPTSLHGDSPALVLDPPRAGGISLSHILPPGADGGLEGLPALPPSPCRAAPPGSFPAQIVRSPALEIRRDDLWAFMKHGSRVERTARALVTSGFPAGSGFESSTVRTNKHLAPQMDRGANRREWFVPRITWDSGRSKYELRAVRHLHGRSAQTDPRQSSRQIVGAKAPTGLWASSSVCRPCCEGA